MLSSSILPPFSRHHEPVSIAQHAGIRDLDRSTDAGGIIRFCTAPVAHYAGMASQKARFGSIIEVA
jgi:hypothetical protein